MKTQLDEVVRVSHGAPKSGAVHVGKLKRRIYRVRSAADTARDAAAKLEKSGKVAEAQSLLAKATELDQWADAAEKIAATTNGELPNKTSQNSQENGENNSNDEESNNASNKAKGDGGAKDTNLGDDHDDGDAFDDGEDSKQQSDPSSNNGNGGNGSSKQNGDSSEEGDADEDGTDEYDDEDGTDGDDEDEDDEDDPLNQQFDDDYEDEDDDNGEVDFGPEDNKGKGSSQKQSEDEDDESDDDEDNGKGSQQKQSNAGNSGSSSSDGSSDGDDNPSMDDDLSVAMQMSTELIENPFDETPKAAQRANTDENGNMKIIKKSDTINKNKKLDAMKKVLKTLVKGEKDGAYYALLQILNKRGDTSIDANTELKKIFDSKSIIYRNNKNESFQEAYKSMELMDDDEFEDTIGEILNDINTISPVTFEQGKDARISKITQDNTSRNNKKLTDEDKKNKIAELHAKANKDEISKYSANRFSDTAEFISDLEDAIVSQIKLKHQKEQTYSVENRRHSGSSILVKGTRDNILPQTDAIKLILYLDCSASFNSYDISRERAFVSSLTKYVDSGDLVIDIKYFAYNIFSDYYSARQQGGTEAWDEILEDINAEEADNVVIVTDSDMEEQAQRSKKTWVPGCVWYIWKYTTAPSMLDHLWGDNGTWQYKLV